MTRKPDAFETWLEGRIAHVERRIESDFKLFDTVIVSVLKTVLEMYRKLMKQQPNGPGGNGHS